MGRKPTNITIEQVREQNRLRANKFYKKHREEIIANRKQLKLKNKYAI